MNTKTTTALFPIWKWQQLFCLGIFFYIIVQCLMPELERKIFWGEFFVFLATFCLLFAPLNANNYQRHILLLVSTWFFIFPLYGLIISIFFWRQDFVFIFYLRHLAFFYYSIFFVFAFNFGNLIIHYLKKYGSYFLFFVPIALFIFGAYGGLGLFLLGLMLVGLSEQKGGNGHRYYLGLAITIGIPLFSHASGTNKIILIFYISSLGLCYLARFWTKYIPSITRKVITYTLCILALVYAIRFINEFYDLTSYLSSMGYTLGILSEVSEKAYTDLSGFWRLVLWSHLYKRFLDYPWGLGLGTPLFENWLDGFVMLHLYRPGENYIQGAHNSFVTFIARLGIPALLLFSLLFFYTVKMTKDALHKINFQPLKTDAGRLLLAALFVLAPPFLEANFNVTLESPLYAGIFWFSFGLFTKITGDIISLEPKAQKTNLLDVPVHSP